MQTFMEPSRPEILRPGHEWGFEPGFDCFSGPFDDLEAHRPSCLALNNRSSVLDLACRIDVGDREPHQVAATQLAVDGEVEKRQFAGPIGGLEADPDRPDVLGLKWPLLADNPPLIPDGAAGADGWQIGVGHGESSDPPRPHVLG